MSRLSVVTTVPALATQAEAQPLVIANGTLEALKWLALVLMTLDHVNKYLLNYGVSVLFSLGRLAMPLFVFVLAYNLARNEARADGIQWRIVTRLLFYATFASIPYIAFGKVYGGWWPLNILFTLVVATIVIGLIEQGGGCRTTLAIVVFVIGGGLVEYWWFAVGLAIVAWRYCKRPSRPRLLALVACMTALWLINQNPWALAALPLILAASWVALAVPRFPYWFYIYYPAHLGILFVLTNYVH